MTDWRYRYWSGYLPLDLRRWRLNHRCDQDGKRHFRGVWNGVPQYEPGAGEPAAYARRTIITSFGAEVIDYSAADDPEEQPA